MMIMKSVLLSSVIIAAASSPLQARVRHSNISALRQEAAQLRREVASVGVMVKELKAIRDQIRGSGSMAVVPMPINPDVNAKIPVPDRSMFAEQPGPQLASLTPSGAPVIEPRIMDRLTRVFPCNCTQRGQFRDQRRTHRHAGLDLGGEYGSPIVASYSGIVLPAPGGDRGYGPIVRVIKSDNGIVARYAHMATVRVKVGRRVEAGEQIGTMGKVGARGFPHLHFELMTLNEYRHRPYGVHSLDPNSLLGGRRGSTMVAGNPMPVNAGTQLASLDPMPVVGERVRVRRQQARQRHHHVRNRHRRHA